MSKRRPPKGQRPYDPCPCLVTFYANYWTYSYVNDFWHRRSHSDPRDWTYQGRIIHLPELSKFYLIRSGMLARGWQNVDLPQYFTFDRLQDAIVAGELLFGVLKEPAAELDRHTKALLNL